MNRWTPGGRCLLTLSFALGLVLSPLVAVGARAASHYANPQLLASADWLKAHRHDPDVKVVALTPKRDFVEAHIPGASQINWPALGLTDTSPASVARWRNSMAQKLTQLGISPHDTVVVYDGGTLFAARLWYWITSGRRMSEF